VIRSRATVALILVAGLCSAPAPAVHIHPDHDADHHSAPLVHSHFGVHVQRRAPASTLEDHDAAAVYLQTVAAVPSATHVPATAITSTSAAPTAPLIQSAVFWFDVTIASFHDPPFSIPALRAPPLPA
jgi:hypothetical protein